MMVYPRDKVFRLPHVVRRQPENELAVAGFTKISGCLDMVSQGSLKTDSPHHNASAAKQ